MFPELGISIDRPPICPKCVERAEQEKVEAARRWRIENIEVLMADAGVPKEFLKHEFLKSKDGPIKWGKAMDPILETCVAYSLKPEGALVLSGKTGRGKTHLAVSILREHLLRGRKGKFEVCMELMNAVRSVYRARQSDDDSTEQEVVNRVGKGLVILDDLGATRVTPLMKDIMTLIVDRCERNGQPIVVTTNLSMAELGEQIDERLASRLVGLCKSSSRVITLEGPDFRLKRR